MPDVNDLKKWLKISDLSLNDIVKILDEGAIREFDYKNKETGMKESGKALEIGVSVNGSIRKGLTLNNLSVQSLSSDWGSNTQKWVGHTAIVDEAKAMKYGKLASVNYLKPAPKDVEEWNNAKA